MAVLPPLPQLILNDNFEDPITNQLGGSYEVNGYRIFEMLGSGTFGVVRKALHIATQTYYAAKILFLPTIDRKRRLQMIESEAAIIRITKHPNIIALRDNFLDDVDDKYYLIFDLCSGGELYDRIVEARRFTERAAGVVAATLLNAAAFLHSPPHPIIHRDLKLENILFRTADPNSRLVIVDFGVAMLLEESLGRDLTEIVGSRPNMAPELIQGKPYDEKVDIWAIGIIVFTLLSGTHPFQEQMEDPDPHVLSNAIIEGGYSMDDRNWSRISDSAKEFVSWLLKVDPDERPSAQMALDKSSWLRNCCPAGYIDYLELVNVEYLRRQYEELNERPPESLLSYAEVKRRRESLPNWTFTAGRRRTLRAPPTRSAGNHNNQFAIERIRTTPVGEPNTPIALTFTRDFNIPPPEPSPGPTPTTPSVAAPPLTILPSVSGSLEKMVLSPSSESISWGTPMGSPPDTSSQSAATDYLNAIAQAAASSPRPELTRWQTHSSSSSMENLPMSSELMDATVSSSQFEQIPLLKIADMDAIISPALSPRLAMMTEESPAVSTFFSPDTLSPTHSAHSLIMDSPPSPVTSSAGVSRPPSRPVSRTNTQSNLLLQPGSSVSAPAGPMIGEFYKTWPQNGEVDWSTLIPRSGRQQQQQQQPSLGGLGSPTISPPNEELYGGLEDNDEEDDAEARAMFELWAASMKKMKDATLRRKAAVSSPSSPFAQTSFSIPMPVPSASSPSSLGGTTSTS